MAGAKIFILIDQMETGGAGRVTSILLPGLVQKGYEVVMAFDNVNCGTFYNVPDEVKQVPVQMKNRDRSGIKQIRLIRTVRRVIKQEKPDVVLAVTFFPFFYAHFATMFMRIPVIAYDHTSFGRKMGWFADYIRYHLYGRADKLVILTQKDADLLGRKFQRKVVVYNPLTFSICKTGTERDKSILCAGRLDSWYVKGIDRMFKIWASVSPDFPGWKLQIAGGCAESTFQYLKSMAEDAGILESVEFLGQVTDMPSLYGRSAIFALPSRVEGFPMVLLEAMSQGCVCVSFEMGGAIREIMSPESGMIVPDGDIQGFSNVLADLMNEYPYLEGRREAGYSESSRFTCESFYEKWDEIIKRVLRYDTKS